RRARLPLGGAHLPDGGGGRHPGQVQRRGATPRGRRRGPPRPLTGRGRGRPAGHRRGGRPTAGAGGGGLGGGCAGAVEGGGVCAGEVPVQVELDRVLPVIEAVRAASDVPVSVDTRKAEVAREALRVGAVLVNDVSGLGHDAALARAVAEAGAALALMHIQGTPETMQVDPRYDDVVAEVIERLASGIERAVAAGVARERLWVDPGIGFGKT